MAKRLLLEGLLTLLVTLAALVAGRHGGNSDESSGAFTASGWHCHSVDARYNVKLTDPSPCLKVIHPTEGYAVVSPSQNHFQFKIDVIAQESERQMTQVEIDWFRVLGGKYFYIKVCRNYPICNVRIPQLDEEETQFIYHVSVHYHGKNETASQDIVLDVAPKSSEEGHQGFAPNLPSESKQNPFNIEDEKTVLPPLRRNSQPTDQSSNFPEYPDDPQQQPTWNSAIDQTHDYGQDKPDTGFRNGNEPLVGLTRSKTNLGPQTIPGNVQDSRLEPSPVSEVSLEDEPLETDSVKQFPLSKPRQNTNYRLKFPFTRNGKKFLKSRRFWRTLPPRFIDEAPSDSDIAMEDENADRILNAINSFSEMLKYPEPTTQTTVDQHDFQILSKGLNSMQKNVSNILKILSDSERQSPDQLHSGDAKHEIGTGAISKQGEHQNPNTSSQGEGKAASQRKVNGTLFNTLNQMAKNYEDIQELLNSLPIPVEDAPISAQDDSGGTDERKRVKRHITSHDSRSLRKHTKKRPPGHSPSPEVKKHFSQMWQKLGLRNGDGDRHDYDTSRDKNDKYQTYFDKNREHLESHGILKHIEGKDFQTKIIVTPEPDVLVRQDFVLMAPTPALETTSSTLEGKAKDEPFQLHLQPFPEHDETNTHTYSQSPGVLSQTAPLNDSDVSTESFSLPVTSTSNPTESVFEQTTYPSLRHSDDYESEEDDTDVFDENVMAQSTRGEGIFHPNRFRMEHSTRFPFAQNQNFGFEVEEDNTDVLDYSTTTVRSDELEINILKQNILSNATTVTSGIDHVYHRLELNPDKIPFTTSVTDKTDIRDKLPFQIYENPFPNRQAPSQTTTTTSTVNSDKGIEKPTNKPNSGYVELHIIPDSQHLDSSPIAVIKLDSKMVNVSINGMIKASNFKFLSEILDLLQDGEVSLPFVRDKKGNNVVIINQENYGIHFTDHNSQASPGRPSMNISKDGSSFLEKLLKYHDWPGKVSDGRTGKNEVHIHIIDVDGYHLNGHNEATRSKENSGGSGIHHIDNSHTTDLRSRYNDKSSNLEDDYDNDRMASWSSEYDEDEAEDGAGDGPNDIGSYQYEVELIPNQREHNRNSRARRNADVDKDAEKSIQGRQIKRTASPAWSEWGTWSACSVTCGKGGLVRERDCLPEDTKQPCDGSDKEETECVMEACLEEEEADKVVKEEGHSTEVECQYDKTKTLKEIHWLTPKGNKITTASTAFSNKYKIVGNKLIVRGVQQDDEGTYRCVVTMEDGSSETADAELEVVTCEPNPCMHGGKCIEYNKGNGQLLKCSCPVEYEGHTCEKLAAGNAAAVIVLLVLLFGAIALCVVGIRKRDKLRDLIFRSEKTEKAHSGSTQKTVLEMGMLSPSESLLTDAEIDLFREISREEFRNFKTSNSYSMFKGKSEKREPQAVLDIEEIHKTGTEVEDRFFVVSDRSAPSDISEGMSSIKSTSLGVKTPTKKTSAASLSLPPSPSPAIEKVDQQRSSHIALSDHGQSNLEDVLSLVEYQESKPRWANVSTLSGHIPTTPPTTEKQQSFLEDGRSRSGSLISGASVPSRSSTPKAKRSLFAPTETAYQENKEEPIHGVLNGPLVVKSSSGNLCAIKNQMMPVDSPVNKEVQEHLPADNKKQVNVQRIMSTKSSLSTASPSSQNAMLIAKEIVNVMSAQALSISAQDSLSKSASETKLQHVTGMSSYHTAMEHFSSTDAANKDDVDQESAVSDNWHISEGMSSIKSTSSGVKTPTKKISAASLSLPPSPSPGIEKVDQQRSSHIALSDHGQSNLEDVLSLVEYQESKPRSANVSTLSGHIPTTPPTTEKQQSFLEDGRSRSGSLISGASVPSRSSTPKAKRSLFAPTETAYQENKEEPIHGVLNGPLVVKSSSGNLRAIKNQMMPVDSPVNKEVQEHLPADNKKQVNVQRIMSTKSSLSTASPSSQNAMLIAKEIVNVMSAQALSISAQDSLSKSASETKLQHVTGMSSYHTAMEHFSSTDAANKDDVDQESAVSDNWHISEGMSSIKSTSSGVKTPTKKISAASLSLPPSPSPGIEKVDQQRSSHIALSDHGQSNLEDVLSLVEYQESKPRSANVSTSSGHIPTTPPTTEKQQSFLEDGRSRSGSFISGASVSSRPSTPIPNRSLFAPTETVYQENKDEPTHGVLNGPLVVKSSSGNLRAIKNQMMPVDSPVNKEVQEHLPADNKKQVNVQRIMSTKSSLSTASPSSQNAMLIAKEIVNVMSAQALSISAQDSLSKSASETKLQHVTGMSSYHTAMEHFSSTDAANKDDVDQESAVSDNWHISEGMSSIKSTSSGVKTPTKKISAASLSLPPSPSPAIEKVDQQRSSHIALSDHGQSNLEDVLSLVEYQESKPRSANVSTSSGHIPTTPPTTEKQQSFLEDGRSRSGSFISGASVSSRPSTPKANRSLFAPTETVYQENKDEPTHGVLNGPLVVKSSSGNLRAIKNQTMPVDSPVNKEVQEHLPTDHKKEVNVQKVMSTKSSLSPASPISQNAMLIAKEIVKVMSAQALSISAQDSLPKSASEAKLQHVTGISSYHTAMAHFSSTDAANKDDFDQQSAVSENWQPLQEIDGTEIDMIRTSTPTNANAVSSPSEDNLSDGRPLENVSSDLSAGNQEEMAKQAASQKRRGSKFGYSGYVERFTHLKK